jgi:hypothetical protein
MSNLTIFQDPSNLPTVRRQSKLLDKMGSSGGSPRRIALNTNGTFKRIVNGEQIGKAVPHQLDVIVVDLLADPSRQFYASKYDPNAQATLPDCWSNDGKTPDAKAAGKPASSCAACPKNVEGSGENGRGRACRFLRRVAVLVVGDPSGEVYQMQIPAASLFGKGTDNVHPFESYKKFLMANGEAVDTVVTRVMYDLDADTMKLKFTPVRLLTEVEAGFVDAAQEDPETKRYVGLSVVETGGANKAIAAPAEPKTIEAKPIPAAPAAPAGNPFGDDDGEEEEAPAAPVKRAAPKRNVVDTVTAKPELKQAMASWLDADGDEGE